MATEDPRPTLDTLAAELARRQAAHTTGATGGRWRRRLLRGLVGVVALVLLTLAGIFIVNFFRLNSDLIEGHIKGGVLPAITRGAFPLEVGRISGDLLHGIELEYLQVRNPAFSAGGVLLAVPRITLSYSLWDVFFGDLVLEKVIIHNPVITLSRGADGRAIWDFPVASGVIDLAKMGTGTETATGMSTGTETSTGTKTSTTTETAAGTDPASSSAVAAGPSATSGAGGAGAGTPPGSRGGGSGHAIDRAQAIADRYLSHVEIRNLSVMVPQPRELLPDQTLARLLRLPAGNFYRTGVNLLVRKFPGRDFTTHLLKLTLPDDPGFLTFQVTRLNTTGDLTLSAQALGQNLEFAVQNIGAPGRRILVYDGRDKERLNLRWILGRPGKPWPERITGLTGVLRLDALTPLEAWLPEGSQLAGRVAVSLVATESAPLRETVVNCQATGLRAELPGLPPLEHLDLRLSARGGVASIEQAAFTVAGFPSSHTGTLDLRDPDAISGEFASELAGDPLSLRTGWRKQGPGHALLSLAVGRPGGELSLETQRHESHGRAEYRDLAFCLEIGAGRSLEDLVPVRLLPADLRERFAAFFDKVTVLGPLRAEAMVPTPVDWPRGVADIILDGARLQNRAQPALGVDLGGRLRLGAGRLDLLDTTATLAGLQALASGSVVFAPGSRRVEAYDLAVRGALTVASRALTLTGVQVADSCGLASPPFDTLEVEGGTFLEAALRRPGPPPTARLAFDRLRLRTGRGQPWWVDALRAEVRADVAPDLTATAPWQPRLVEATASLRLFGVDLALAAAADLASRTFGQVRVEGKGADLQTILQGVSEIPTVGAALKKWGLSVGGAFSFTLAGAGPFARPAVAGGLDVPRLTLKAREASADLPFVASFSSPAEGRYQAQVRTRKAGLTVRGVAFPFEAAQAEVCYDRSQGGPQQVIGLDVQVQSVGATVTARGEYLPQRGQIKQATGRLASPRIEDLAREIARIGKFNLPFTLVGKATGEWKASGPVTDPRGEGFVEVDRLGLTFPLRQRGNQTIALQVEDLAGRLEVTYGGQAGDSAVALKGGRGKVLGADLTIEGAGRLRRRGEGRVPEFDRLVASFTGLAADRLFALLKAGFFPAETATLIPEMGGTLAGSLVVGGAHNRFHAEGEARIENGRLAHRLLQAPLEGMNGRFLFSRKADRPYPVVEIRDFSASFGRTRFGIPLGRFTDPQGAGGLELEGRIERAFPADIMKLMSGWSLPTVSFPKEGALSGRVKVDGSLARPRLDLDLRTEAMLVEYRTDQQTYLVPLGSSTAALTFDPQTGEARIASASLGLLLGRIEIGKAWAVIDKGRPKRFELAGTLKGVDIGTLRAGGEPTVRGRLDGTFKAEQTATGSREALFQLVFHDLVVPTLPVDPEAMNKIGLDVLDSPEFREGRLNLYLSSDEEADQVGRVRVADGLFAGPDMRLEIGNSAFDPLNLQLEAKVFFNPQPLRRTKLGQRLGSLTKHLQDSKTGLPYVDLTVSGRWDNPGLLGRTITKRAERRGKRNFIKSIFGGRRTHKASVQELMEWFPGWKPGE